MSTPAPAFFASDRLPIKPFDSFDGFEAWVILSLTVDFFASVAKKKIENYVVFQPHTLNTCVAHLSTGAQHRTPAQTAQITVASAPTPTMVPSTHSSTYSKANKDLVKIQIGLFGCVIDVTG
jgi:hypothetical protein